MSKFTPLSLSFLVFSVMAATAQNTVTFDNQSGEPALVKLIGPTQKDVEVANGAKAPVEVAAGRYFIKVRYGLQGNFHYAKGNGFDVRETATTRSEITITLHKVIAGNYESQPISEKEFGESVTKSAGKKPASEGLIRVIKAQFKDERALMELTSFGIAATMVKASAGKRFLLVDYSLEPPAKLPALPEEAVSWSKRPPPPSEDVPRIIVQKIKQLREKYQKEFNAREEAARDLLPVVISQKGERLQPVNQIGIVDWSVSVISGSKGFFLMEEEAIFEVPADCDRFTIQVEGYKPLEITPKELKAR